MPRSTQAILMEERSPLKTRVFIVDDHPAVRDGLASRFSAQPDLEVCGEADGVAQALQRIQETEPDVAVVDIQLKDGDGLDLVKRIKSRHESVRILVWSMYPDSLYARRALSAGALGYINKENTTGRIVDAVRRVAEGKIYLSEEISDRVLGRLVGGTGAAVSSPIESLSDRELQVFRLIGEGLSTTRIAERLHLSSHTVDTHRQRIKQKFNIDSASQLARIATRWVLEGG